jgi:hypothetical protein
MAQQLDLPKIFRDSMTTNFEQDIKQFLGKWVMLAQSSVTTVSSGTLQTIQLPSTLLNDPLYEDKLSGFQGMRGTIRIKLLANANPFQQCRLILAFIPLAGVVGSTSSWRLNTLAEVTQLPKVEMDVACDSEVELAIPYVGPLAYHDLINGLSPWGSVYLYVYSPLAVGTGSNTFNYILMGSFEPSSLELVNPTYNENPSRPRDRLARFQSGERPIAHVAKFQMKSVRRTKKGAVTEKEAEAQGGGTVSSMLAVGKKVASSLTAVPALSAVAGPTAWALGIASGVAGYFGWSKPRMETQLSRVVTQAIVPFSGNYDAPDCALPLAASNANKLAIMPGFAGNDIDEMSFDYLVTKGAWFTTYTITTADPALSLIGYITVCPIGCRTMTGAGATTQYHGPPVTYLAEFFKYWRGDMRYTFKFCKTEYHQARLAIAFFPGVNVAPVYIDTDWVHREFIDLSAGNEFSFVVPFASTQPYLNTAPIGDAMTGVVGIYLVNGLTAPSTCASSITIMVEGSGMPGFEFACPNPNGVQPYGLVVPALKEGKAQSSRLSNLFARYAEVSEFKPAKKKLHEAYWLGADGKLRVPREREEPCPEGVDPAGFVNFMASMAFDSFCEDHQEVVKPYRSLLNKNEFMELNIGNKESSLKVKIDRPPAATYDKLRRIYEARFQSKSCSIADNVVIGNSKTAPPSVEMAKYCIGERMCSVRQLLLLSSPAYVPTFATKMKFKPFTFGMYNSKDGAVRSIGPFALDYLSAFAGMYAFWRGGVRLQYLNLNNVGGRAFVWLDRDSGDAPVVTGSNDEPLQIGGQCWQEGNVRFEVPYYSKTHMSLVRYMTANVGDYSDVYLPNTQVCYIESNTNVGQGYNYLLRSASEDFQFGYFLGVLPYSTGLDFGSITSSQEEGLPSAALPPKPAVLPAGLRPK